MVVILRSALIMGAAWATLAVAGSAAEAGSTRSQGKGFVAKYVAGRLRVGATFTHYALEDTRRSGDSGYDNGNLDGNFLGSLWGLDVQQHWWPNPYVEYRILSGFGLGVGYDQLRAKTLDWANDERTAVAGDGDVEMRGVGVYVFGRYRNRTRLEPYGSIGYSWYESSFDVSPGWAAPGRRFEVENTSGWMISVGANLALTRKIAADVTLRHSEIGDIQARAYFRPNRYRAGAFPMQYNALGFGAVITF